MNQKNYPDYRSTSYHLNVRGRKVLPNGGSRSSIQSSPYTIFLKSGHGKNIVDVDGRKLIDFNNNFTSLIHGHCHPAIVSAATEQISMATAFSFGSEIEIKLAELLCQRVDGFEQIRFMNSGTEAVMNGIKVARAYTGRAKIAKCENAYHGSYAAAEASLAVDPTDLKIADPISKAYSAGTPQGVLDDVIIIPFNDVENSRRILNQYGSELAGILFDPFGSGLGRIAPSQDFINLLAEMRDTHGLLLISDEVIAFRADYLGCMHQFNTRADVTCLGKIIGGGFPVGAVAGSRDVMSVFESTDEKARLPHGGTFNANPVTMAAGYAAMEMMTPEAFLRINSLGQAFRNAITDVLEQMNLQANVLGQASVFAIDIIDPRIGNKNLKRGALRQIEGIEADFINAGYFLSAGLHGTVSTAMDENDIDPFCDTLKSILKTM
ncbi:MAG: aminotransferase class III-fold pyridoxal phosphate-dependent enzyme [Gammaproteobacteria bacterium]|jgi:glutamate-1-semialdehyde 2,1-aminomutase|nr:aminotransferase class III-fold pyridoxal phosphate-dependent enzyme [Gammaproteobacteria bacterium]MBT5601642.1 aminotransferase class III-fold pyridoxal phosphate-dependent enzyme [Gammaproteobacteria bacterium]